MDNGGKPIAPHDIRSKLMTNSLAIFEGYKMRRHYDEQTETWHFSVVDIIQVLIQQPDYQVAKNH